MRSYAREAVFMDSIKDVDILRENADVLRENIRRNTQLCNGLIREITRLFLSQNAHTDPATWYKSAMSDNLCTPEFAQYCLDVCQEAHPFSPEDFLPESVRIGDPPALCRVSYQKNNYSDRAFSRFFGELDDAEAVFLPTTASVCEDVYYGRCTHCILPIYSSQDGILTTFTKMIEKYDLTIHAVCNVTISDNDSFMRFALLRHEPALPSTDPCYVQFNVVLPQSITIGRLLHACETFDSYVSEIISYPLAYTTEGISYTIRLRVPLDNLTALMMFLRSILDNYSLEGVFTMIQ